MRMQLPLAAAALFAIGTIAAPANAVPTPATAVAVAGAGYVLSLTGGVIGGIFETDGSTVVTPAQAGAEAAAIGPSRSTDCAVEATECGFGGVAGGAAIASDGFASVANFSGGYSFVLSFFADGVLTLGATSVGAAANAFDGEDPVGLASAETFLSPLVLEGIESFSLASEEVRRFALDAGVYVLTWGGVGAVAVAARSLSADVAEPATAALIGSMVVLLGGLRTARRKAA